jgi:hypothetical protein
MRLAVRSWLIRGLILAGVAALVAFGWVANSWVSPERVRSQLVAHLDDQFHGVDVHVGSARMRILGGIAVTDLQLTRRGDPQPFLVVPAAVIYHDKEQLNRGRLVIRKVELENPQLRLERSAEGAWNLAEVLREAPADHPVPTFVAKGATLSVTDHSPGGLPPLKLSDVQLTLLNDPLPVLTVQAQGGADGFGPFAARAQVNRITRHSTVRLELTELPVGPAVVAAAGRFAPHLAPHLTRLSATAAIKADLTYVPEATPAWRHDVRVEIRDGRFEHPELPWPVEQIALKAHSVDGRVRVEEATARFGPAQIRASLETRTEDRGQKADDRKPTTEPVAPASREPKASADEILACLEDRLQKLEVSVGGVPLDDTLFARFGEKGAKVKRTFSPTGTVDLGYKFTREAAGWKREFEVRPRSLSVVYEKFRYPVADVRGWVKRTVTHASQPVTVFDLRGTAGGQVTLQGQVSGDGDDPAVNLRITGTDVPLDDKLVAALPGKYPELVRQFRATARGDFVAEIVEQQGVNLSENEFRIEVRDGTVNYSRFPYPFEKVKGRVVVRTQSTNPARPIRPGEAVRPLPDNDELTLDGFTAVHGGATVWLNGSKRARPGSRDRVLVLHVGGTNCPVDSDLRTALGELKLDSIWTTFDPKASLTFTADVEVLDRAPPPHRPDDDPPFDPAADLKLTFNFSGPTVTPSFFPYGLTDLSGGLEYHQGRLRLSDFAGRHGETRVKLAAGEVRFYPDGVVWANLGGLEMRPFAADPAFLAALPPKLRSGMEELKLKGGAELAVKQLVVLTPPDPPPSALPPPDPLPIGPAAGPQANLLGPRVGGQFNPSPVPSPNRGGGQAGNRLSPSSLAGKGAGGLGPTDVLARGQSPPVPAALAGTPPGAAPPRPLPTSPPQPDPIVYWDAELKLAGASLDTGLPWEELFGSVACRGRYEGTHLGLVRGNVWLDRAVIAGQPVTGLKAHVCANPQVPDPTRPGEFLPVELAFTNVSGTLFHGLLGGEARVVLSENVRYELWLTATDVQLDEVARHYLNKPGTDADLKGIAQAQLYLYNRPDPRTGRLVVEGTGKIDVPTGRMYNLPILLDLVKVFKWQLPDKTAFEEAHAVFRIRGDRVIVDQLDLIGNAVCLGGSGEVDFNGDYVRFEFYTIWSKVLKQMINTPVGDLSAFLSKNLFKIRMVRENGELKYKPEPVPAVSEPARVVAERLKSRAGRLNPR